MSTYWTAKSIAVLLPPSEPPNVTVPLASDNVADEAPVNVVTLAPVPSFVPLVEPRMTLVPLVMVVPTEPVKLAKEMDGRLALLIVREVKTDVNAVEPPVDAVPDTTRKALSL